MAIPISTTKIDVLRQRKVAEDAEPYSGEVASDRYVVASNVRAVIGSAGSIGMVSGRERKAGGEQEKTVLGLRCDPCEINHKDWIKDRATGIVYEVEFATLRSGLGVSYIQARVAKVEGLV